MQAQALTYANTISLVVKFMKHLVCSLQVRSDRSEHTASSECAATLESAGLGDVPQAATATFYGDILTVVT